MKTMVYLDWSVSPSLDSATLLAGPDINIIVRTRGMVSLRLLTQPQHVIYYFIFYPGSSLSVRTKKAGARLKKHTQI